MELAKKLVINTKFKSLRLVGGVELLGTPSGEFLCVIVVVDYRTMEPVESAMHTAKLVMKYIPGFMGFSHGPIILDTFLKLNQKPELLMIKGHGIAHPRRLGIASQLGLQLGIPTIGVATKLLCGNIANDKLMVEGELRGTELRTREFSRPIYVSPGSFISVPKALEVVKHCIRPPHKLPEPLFLAHKLANKQKRLQI